VKQRKINIGVALRYLSQYRGSAAASLRSLWSSVSPEI
jgi:hypothetical protein